MVLYVLKDNLVMAYHEDFQEAEILAHPDYAGLDVIKSTEPWQYGDPTPTNYSVVRNENNIPVRSVTKFQLVRALRALGMKQMFDAAISQADEDTQEDWLLVSTIRRDFPAVVNLALAVGITEEQLDNLFTVAATFD